MRPNLLFLYTDQQRADTLACYGNHAIHMPHLNAFAGTATVVERAIVTQPVCTPSRASLMTGLMPHAHRCTGNNVFLDPAIPCLPELLPGGVYATGHHGKWHLGDEIFAQHGFAEWIATEDTYQDHYAPQRDQRALSPFDRFLRAQGVRPAPVSIPGRDPYIADRFFRAQIHHLPEELSRPTFLANTASRFIREHRDRRWCLAVNFLEPHTPVHSCRDGQYDRSAVTLPANLGAEGDHGVPLAVICAVQGKERRDLAAWRDLTARYWGMCSLVDSAVGRILGALRECGLDDSTLVVFTSDHGDQLGSHGLTGKGVMYEEAIRVPLLIRAPGQRQERRLSGPFSHVDLLPTLLDLLEVAPPAHLHGRSRAAPVSTGGSLADDVVVEWHCDRDPSASPSPLPPGAEGLGTPEALHRSRCDEQRTLVTPEGWKYVHSLHAGEHQLYDRNADPGERINRVGDPALVGTLAVLRARLRTALARTGDGVQIAG